MEIYLIIGIIILIIIIYFFVVYNSLVKTSNLVNEAFSTMDVYLKKRWDLIPSIVETVKGYAKHEIDTFKDIVDLRNEMYDKMSSNNKVEINSGLTKRVSMLIALSEDYPELKANENFLNLSKELSKNEEDIANSRKYYNATVRMMNNKVNMFPSNICAKLFKFKEASFFEANNSERENIEVDLK